MERTLRLPNCKEQAVLDQVQVRLVERAELENFKQLLDEHHYLGSLKEVGQRLHYVATDAQGQWLALLVFSAPAKHPPGFQTSTASGAYRATIEATSRLLYAS